MTTNPYVISGGSNEVMHALHPRLRYPDLWRGCVGAWAPCLGPTGLRLQDNTGRGNHGTLTNMDPATDWVPSNGKIALDFDGTDDQVSIPANTPAMTEISISLWVNVRTMINSTAPRLLTRNDVSSFAVLCVQSAITLEFYVNGVTLGTTVASIVNLGWNHIGATYSSGVSKKLYLNSVLVASATQTATIAATALPIVLGNRASGGRPLNGQLDDVRIYNRALSPSEIALLATRRGIAYETVPRRSYKGAAGGGGSFKAAWANNRNTILGAVVR
jgi:hypothetical protein